MAYLRMTLLRTRPECQDEAIRLMQELDATLAGAPGLLFSLVMCQDLGRVGRVSLWQSKDDANREATSSRTLSLRSRLRYVSLDAEESFMEVQSGYLPEGFSFSAEHAMQRAYFPAAARQAALLAS